MSTVRNSLFFLTVAAGQWTFSWPYGADNSCVCKRSGVSFVAFDTEEECLQAFEDSGSELCKFKKQAVNEDQCDAAVATRRGLYNSACVGECTKAVAGLISLAEYFDDCDFEFVTEFSETVATSSTACFNNLVYGWADFDSSKAATQIQPLKMFEDVPNAARCQELCQDVPECVHFTWKAFADGDSFENEPHTCVLHSQSYMEAVLNTPLSSLDTKYCDASKVTECASIAFPRSEFNIFQDTSCLICDCVPKCAWESPYHVSGPAFCDESRDDYCAYERPSWSTLPPCETEECDCPTCEAPTSAPPKSNSVISTPAPNASVSIVGTPQPPPTDQESTSPEDTTQEEGTPERSWSTSTPAVQQTTMETPQSDEFTSEFTVPKTQSYIPNTSGAVLPTTTKSIIELETTSAIELETTTSSGVQLETTTVIELETTSTEPIETTTDIILDTETTGHESTNASGSVMATTGSVRFTMGTPMTGTGSAMTGSGSVNTGSSLTGTGSSLTGTGSPLTGTGSALTGTGSVVTGTGSVMSSVVSTPGSPNEFASTPGVPPPATPCLDCPQFIDSECDDCESDGIDDCMGPEC